MVRMREISAALTAGAILFTAAACSADGTTAPTTAAASYDGTPTSIEFWGSNPALKKLADAYNAKGGPIKVTFVEQAGAADLLKKLQNAHAAGTDPCVFDTTTEGLTALASAGIVVDITKQAEQYRSAYAPVAWSAVAVGNTQYGIPASSIPTFMLYNAEVFQKAGVAYPTTWEEFIEAGKKLNGKGIKIYNLAGEDYSTYVYLSWQAGAHWWQFTGDGWKVEVDSPATAKAAAVLQQLIDNDVIEKISYAEYAAMMKDYNDGKIASRQLSTWQTKGMQANLTTGLGQWEPAPNLTFAGEAPANVSFTRAYAATGKCANQAAAVSFMNWMTTDKEAISLIADPKEGASWFPAVADPAPYIDISKPDALLGSHADKWDEVVRGAVATQKGDWTYGPNAIGAFEVLGDRWGKAVDKQIKVADIAPEMQKWIVDDLKKSGITVVE